MAINCKKHKKNLEDVLREVNRDIVRIDRNDRICNNKILYAVLKEILSLMKKNDVLFKNLKPRLEYMGSYFDGLRVSQPTEYDINIVLKIPINYDKIQMDASSASHDFTQVIMPSEFRRLSKQEETVKKGFDRTVSWCDPSYRLSIQKVRSWMQSVLDGALHTLPTENNKNILKVQNRFYQISTTIAGPANTITIQGSNLKNKIDIDLVPTFEFNLPKTPSNSAVLFEKMKQINVKQYFLVPKPSNDSFNWRLSFPRQERKLIEDKNYMKSVIKLLKLFRDYQKFDGLASYYIKTLFLWECNLPNSDIFWKTNSLSFLVLHMMEKLKKALEEECIDNFWCPGHNLLDKIEPATIQNWANRVSHVINKIRKCGDKNPDAVLQYFRLPTD